jgi:uncharacterized delta-60 repeat protein
MRTSATAAFAVLIPMLLSAAGAVFASASDLDPTLAADGDLDTSFSVDGLATVDFAIGSTHEERASAAAVGPDGRLVIVGRARFSASDTDFAIARLNPNGTLDTTFSGDGLQTVAFDLGTPSNTQILDEAKSVAIDRSGRIVVCGTAKDATTYRVAVARLTTTGALDATFSGDGKVDLPADPDNLSVPTSICHVFVDSNGAIVLTTGAAVVKLNGSGDLFTTFGTSGYSKASTACGSGWDSCGFRQSVEHPDGYYFTAGWGFNGTTFSDEPILFCHWAGLGGLNGSFAAGGRLVTLPPGLGAGRVERVRLDSLGRLVLFVSTSSGGGFGDFVTRVDVAAEAIDPTFGLVGTPGWLDLDFLNPTETTWIDLALAPDDKILATGMAMFATSSITVARFLRDGNGFDNGFSTDARAETEFVPGGTATVAAVIVTDGRPTVIGKVFNQSDDDFAVARFRSNPLLQDGFEIGSTWRWTH